MTKSVCEKCFHYAACSEIDVTGTVNNPEYVEPCEHFIDNDEVKIQKRAHWIEKIHTYDGGNTKHICYRCSECNNLEKVRGFTGKRWNDYFKDHHREDLELPKFCNVCGSVVDGIFEEE